jgi:hypothetical protein
MYWNFFAIDGVIKNQLDVIDAKQKIREFLIILDTNYLAANTKWCIKEEEPQSAKQRFLLLWSIGLK